MIIVPPVTSRRMLVLALAAVLPCLGACQKKGSPQPPTPTTQAMRAVNAATPASDPSLPPAAVANQASSP